MSKDPEAQGDGAGPAIPRDAMPLAEEHLHDGHLHDGHLHDGHLHDGHLHDGHLHDGHAHHPHAHSDKGAQAQRSQTGKAADAPQGTRVPCIVIVDEDAELCEGLSLTIGASCQTHCVTPARAVALLQSLPAVDVALVDCDPPPSVQAAIFGELARWPSAICVLMSANVQKVEQFRALGVFAPLVLDKPVHPEALEAIRSATLELCRALG